MVECEFISVQWVVTSGAGFNRYMVECESDEVSGYHALSCVLIDTWWNVNYS